MKTSRRVLYIIIPLVLLNIYIVQTIWTSYVFVNNEISTSNRLEVNYNKKYWQVFENNGTKFYIFGAYYDARGLNPNVKILGMAEGDFPVDINCKFWSDNYEETTAKVDVFSYIWNEGWAGNPKNLKPYLISCPWNKEYIPSSVTLFGGESNFFNILGIEYNYPDQKADFAVCVKGLDYEEDNSLRLIEWIELVHLLGANKIFFYVLNVHENVMKVLQYYSERNIINYTPVTLPGNLPNGIEMRWKSDNLIEKRRNELIHYNDCFYKHQYEYRYFVPMDIDEVIMPKEGTWSDLIDLIETDIGDTRYAYYQAKHVIFLDEYTKEVQHSIPKYMHILQHVYRTDVYNNFGVSFFAPDRVLLLHNLTPISCINGDCNSYKINTTDAQLHQYRKICAYVKECEEKKKHIVRDDNVWRFKTELIEKVKHVAKELQVVSGL